MSSLQKNVLSEISKDIVAVEEALHRLVLSKIETVGKVGAHTLEAGGKRLRPAFVILAARATGRHFDIEKAIRLGACLEMVHMATLIHDDVIDNAATRRGRPTASSIFGNTASILSGDVLLAKAMAILAADGDLAIIRAVSDMVVEMAEGEAREVEVRGLFDLGADEHYAILRMKTAAFVECCCRTGAILADAPDEIQDALGTYGHHIGMAFQLVDDLLDFRGDNQKTGKPMATDFREGCATLPLILLREKLSADEDAFARCKFGNGLTDGDVAKIVSWMGERGVYDQAEQIAIGHSNCALTALSLLPESEHKVLLTSITDFVLERQA